MLMTLRWTGLDTEGDKDAVAYKRKGEKEVVSSIIYWLNNVAYKYVMPRCQSF